MAITGIFFIPSNPNASTALPTLTERLRSAFADEPVPIGRWALEHKLMRDTPSCLPASAHAPNPVPKPKYMQFLSLTHYPNHGFVYASEATDSPQRMMADAGNRQGAALPGAPSPAGVPQTQMQQAMSSPAPPAAVPETPSTPSRQQDGSQSGMIMRTIPLLSYGTLFQHFVRACEPFWCHRHTVTVPGGLVYDVGDFRIRMGDVRQTLPVARPRGTVIEVEWRGPSSLTSSSTFNPSDDNEEGSDSGIDLDLALGALEDSEIDSEYALTAQLIREFWAQLGIEGAREAILVPEVGKEVKEQHRRRRTGETDRRRKGCKNRDRDSGWGWWEQDEDRDPDAGVDLARQYMEIFRFNR